MIAGPPSAPRDPGDAWVHGPDGEKYWGRFGAAGLLVWNRSLGVLLQHRIAWSHHGGTWGIPGGARQEGESALAGALREANEEAGVPVGLLKILASSVADRGFWTYTTVVAESVDEFIPVIGDAESEALAWVPLDDVIALRLHPGFALSWPTLRATLI